MATLCFITSAPKGSSVVIDYMLSPSLLTPARRGRFDELAQWVASGETWQIFFDPELLTRDLRDMGFGQVEDNGQNDINTRHFRDRKDGLQVGSLSHIIKAQV